MNDDIGGLLLSLVILILLVATNAFFAMSEIAIISINSQKMKRLAEGGNKAAKRNRNHFDQLEKNRAACRKRKSKGEASAGSHLFPVGIFGDDSGRRHSVRLSVLGGGGG